MKWTTKKINISMKDGNETIEAKCNGIFAIHDFIPLYKGNYKNLKTLTHIPTGRALILRSTTGRLYRAVKELDKLDWEGVAPEVSMPATFDMEVFRKIESNAANF